MAIIALLLLIILQLRVNFSKIIVITILTIMGLTNLQAPFWVTLYLKGCA